MTSGDSVITIVGTLVFTGLVLWRVSPLNGWVLFNFTKLAYHWTRWSLYSYPMSLYWSMINFYYVSRTVITSYKKDALHVYKWWTDKHINILPIVYLANSHIHELDQAQSFCSPNSPFHVVLDKIISGFMTIGCICQINIRHYGISDFIRYPVNRPNHYPPR